MFTCSSNMILRRLRKLTGSSTSPPACTSGSSTSHPACTSGSSSSPPACTSGSSTSPPACTSEVLAELSVLMRSHSLSRVAASVWTSINVQVQRTVNTLLQKCSESLHKKLSQIIICQGITIEILFYCILVSATGGISVIFRGSGSEKNYTVLHWDFCFTAKSCQKFGTYRILSKAIFLSSAV